jgi:hypothetical protein
MGTTAGDIYPNGEVLPAGGSPALGSDDLVRRPLWEFPPRDRLAVLTERARRGFLTNDPEPIGDPEYA